MRWCPNCAQGRVASLPAPGLEQSRIRTFSENQSTNKIDSKVIWIGVVLGIGFGAKLCMHLLRNMFRRGFARRRFRQWVWSRAKQRGVPKEGSVWSKALSKLRHGVGSKVNEVREHSYSSTCSRNQERIRN